VQPENNAFADTIGYVAKAHKLQRTRIHSNEYKAVSQPATTQDAKYTP